MPYVVGKTVGTTATTVAIGEPRRPSYRGGERALARLWRNADTLAEALVTEDGRRLRVVYPGRLSGLAGPDFRDSVIATDTGELLTGDVELHLDAPDWDRHLHHTDPNYNGVILHVVMKSRGRVASRQQSRTASPIASIAVVTDLLRNAQGGRGHRIVELLRDLDEDGLVRLLDHAGDRRFLARSTGFALELESADVEEALYGALMEALGYSANRKPFRQLAKSAPLSTLRVLRDEPGATRLLAIKATLIRAAGLLDYVEPPAESKRLTALLRRVPRTKRISAGDWRMFRVRPANHPARRVAGAAHLVDRHIESGLVSGIEEAVRPREARALVESLVVRPLIGVGRAREMAVNVALPFIHALGVVRRDAELGARCLAIYRAFPKTGDNEITREMVRVISAERGALRVSGARRQQGLMHLYKMMTGQIPG